MDAVTYAAAKKLINKTLEDAGAIAGVSSFNGRSGAVTPSVGDYLVEQVSGAAPLDSPRFLGSISLSRKEGTNIGNGSFAVGIDVTASGDYSHAEGNGCKAIGGCSYAAGAHSVANGLWSRAEGAGCTVESSGPASYAGCYNTIAAGPYQYVTGKYNISYAASTVRFIIGKGTGDTARANCFRVTDTGVYASGNYNASGADYAELFEWLDGNPNNEDRAGLFVTLDEDKLRIASPYDDFILGVVSGNPSVVGDVHDDQWKGMYLYDIYGRPLYEDVEVPDEVMEHPDPEHPGETIIEVIVSAHTETRQKLNPDYDHTKTYIPRTERPEWAAVGMMGKLVVRDDGSCKPNGYATIGDGGYATVTTERTKYRVMQRLDATHVQILIL